MQNNGSRSSGSRGTNDHRGTNEHEASAGGTNGHWGTNKCTNAAWAIVGATHPLSLVPLPPYHLNLFFTYFYVHIILYLEYFNER
jgi:hypothetical protein